MTFEHRLIRGLVAIAVFGTSFLIGVAPAEACSCAAPPSAVEYIGTVDVVFTGTVVANEGEEMQPIWRFAVEGVIKGEVEPEQVVAGHDWALGCGTNFGRFGTQAIVVFANEKNGGLEAIPCAPVPTVEEFAQLSDVPAINQVMPATTQPSSTTIAVDEVEEVQAETTDEAAAQPSSRDDKTAGRSWRTVAVVLGGLAVAVVAVAAVRRSVRS